MRASWGEHQPAAELPLLDEPLREAARWISSRPPATKLERPNATDEIRRNPSEWIGDVRRPTALGTLVDGAMAFALEAAVLGHCRTIELRVHRDGSASVRHELATTRVGARRDAQGVSRGLQRTPWLQTTAEGELIVTKQIGSPVLTNALSHWCRFEVATREGVLGQAFYRGRPQCAVQRLGTLAADLPCTTLVRFRPDPEVFGEASFDIDDLYMRGLGCLYELPALRLVLIDERSRAEPLVIDGSSLP
jgi:DNA gyrase subunit B